MKAAVFLELARPFVVEDVELLPPTDDEVIVRTTATVFCITECMIARGALPKTPPVVLGHSAVGVVEEAGRNVDRVSVGDRVIVPGTPECEVCFWCQRGRPDQCTALFEPQPVIGTRANGEPLTNAGQGTHAEKMKLRQIKVFRVESDLPDDQLSLMGCGITSGLGAVFNAGRVQPGSSVAVVGCGHLGLWIVQGAKVAGAQQIIAVEPRAERRELAGQLGATHLVDPADGDPVEQVRELSEGRGVDYGIEAAGPPAAQEQTFMMTRNAGTVVLTGLESLEATVTLSAFYFALRGRTVESSQTGRSRMRRDIPRYVEMLERGMVDARPIITSRYTLDEINEAAAASEARRDLSGVIMFPGGTRTDG
jgi:S-(hydroxymethyl)glutathione dehydrogenase/alcohol dehydrogenase